jgi:hypothetical protein
VAIQGDNPEIASKFPKRVAPDRTLAIRVSFVLRNRAELDRRHAEMQNRASSKYHRAIPPADFAARYQPTPSEVADVKDRLHHVGFTIIAAEWNED